MSFCVFGYSLAHRRLGTNISVFGHKTEDNVFGFNVCFLYNSFSKTYKAFNYTRSKVDLVFFVFCFFLVSGEGLFEWEESRPTEPHYYYKRNVMGKGGPLHHQHYKPIILPPKTKKKREAECTSQTTDIKTILLTPVQKLGDVLLSPERGVVALIVETHQDIQQRLHTQALAIRLSWPVQDQLLQLLQTHLSRHDYSGLLVFELMMVVMKEVVVVVGKRADTSSACLVSTEGPVKK